MRGKILQDNMEWNAEQAGRGRRYVRQGQRMQEGRDAVRRIFREVSQNKKRGLE